MSTHSYVSIYSYPDGQLVGKLKGFYLASGQCVDGSNHVYVTGLWNEPSLRVRPR